MSTEEFLAHLCNHLSRALAGYNNEDAQISEMIEQVNDLMDIMDHKGVPIVWSLIRKGRLWLWNLKPTANAKDINLTKTKIRLKRSLKSFYKRSEIYFEEDKILFNPLAIHINSLRAGFRLKKDVQGREKHRIDDRIFYKILLDGDKRDESSSESEMEARLPQDQFMGSESDDSYRSESGVSHSESESSEEESRRHSGSEEEEDDNKSVRPSREKKRDRGFEEKTRRKSESDQREDPREPSRPSKKNRDHRRSSEDRDHRRSSADRDHKRSKENGFHKHSHDKEKETHHLDNGDHKRDREEDIDDPISDRKKDKKRKNQIPLTASQEEELRKKRERMSEV